MYKHYLKKLTSKFKTKIALISKLAGTTWDENIRILCTSTMTLLFSVAKYLQYGTEVTIAGCGKLLVQSSFQIYSGYQFLPKSNPHMFANRIQCCKSRIKYSKRYQHEDLSPISRF